MCTFNCLLTVDHQLHVDFDVIRQRFYTAFNLKDRFRNAHPKWIISVIPAIVLTNKLWTLSGMM